MTIIDHFDIRTIINLEADPTNHTLDEFIASVRHRYGLANSLYASPSFSALGMTDPLILTSYSDEWTKHYRDHECTKIDPVFHAACRGSAPIDWSRLSRKNKNVRKFFNDATDAGVGRHGLTIPVRDHSGAWSLFTVTSDDSDADWSARRYDLLKDVIHVAYYVHQRVYETHAPRVPIDCNTITKREIEAIKWAADGHDLTSIARHMRISVATVRVHIESVRYKLRALNRTHAVSKAIKCGLI